MWDASFQAFIGALPLRKFRVKKYDDVFFDYIDAGAIGSARVAVARLFPLLRPASVLDIGCGRGGWLKAWQQGGAQQVQGIDGDYVDRERLYIDAGAFRAIDLSQPFDLGRRFDLVQSLEVAEHIPAARAAGFIDGIARHGDIVLFAAAVPGQGGTGHVNERPLDYWRGLFAARGYGVFDTLRPLVKDEPQVEFWYRYNTLLYANAAGQARLGPQVLATRVADGVPLKDFGTFTFRMRKAVLRHLPVSVVDEAAAINARLHRMLRPAR